jgi:leucyl-tRNA synthetase
LRILHKTLKAVTADVEGLRFNTAVSRLMEFVNFFTAQNARPAACMEAFVLMLSPLAPHLAEELWLAMGHTESLAEARWPDFEEQYTRDDMMEIPVQINGRVRARLLVSCSAGREELEQAALSDPKIRKHLENLVIRKVILVPNKLVNIVAG